MPLSRKSEISRSITMNLLTETMLLLLILLAAIRGYTAEQADVVYFEVGSVYVSNTSPQISYSSNIGGSELTQIGAVGISDMFNRGPNPVYQQLDKNHNHISSLNSQRSTFEHQSQILKQSLESQITNTPYVTAIKDKETILRESKSSYNWKIDPSQIPDPQPHELPYTLQLPQGQFKEELYRIYKDLYKINPRFPRHKTARHLGLLAVEEADYSYIQTDQANFAFLKKLAEEFMSIAIGIDPVTGLGRSTYELFTGKDLISGIALTTFDRSLAFVGVISLGTETSVVKTSQLLLKLANKVSHFAIEVYIVQQAIEEGGKIIESWLEISEENVDTGDTDPENTNSEDQLQKQGRQGRQERLRQAGEDDKESNANKGWIKQEENAIERGQRKTIRNPPGKELAHERGREAAKGYDYKHTKLQDKDLHRLQHKYDNFGRKNKDRPITK
jgi:hypothetical protein